MVFKGIDVSKWQGTINWDTVANTARPDFVMIRLGTGVKTLVPDIEAVRNLAACNRLGIPCGVYVYTYSKTPDDAAMLMNSALNYLESTGCTITMPVALDIEYDSVHTCDTMRNNTDKVKRALQVAEDRGYYAMLYCSENFLAAHLYPDELTEYDKWLAAYRIADTIKAPHGMWQASGSGVIPGIGGNVDLDYAYHDYPAIIAKAGLNKPTNTPASRLHTMTITPISDGDLATIKEMCDALRLSYTVT